mmetsp:Transcript_12683/g.44722  ORF Transcript_12683/g.44722 Transcript_12683/m.44722 type:complete len:738 (-) Transcript_12683:72-2285(-)
MGGPRGKGQGLHSGQYGPAGTPDGGGGGGNGKGASGGKGKGRGRGGGKGGRGKGGGGKSNGGGSKGGGGKGAAKGGGSKGSKGGGSAKKMGGAGGDAPLLKMDDDEDDVFAAAADEESEPDDEEASDVDDDDDADDDDDDESEDDLAWGKSKKGYYGGDTGDLEIGQETEDAVEEEAIAAELQQKQLEALDEADFALDGVSGGDDGFGADAAASGGLVIPRGGLFGDMASLMAKGGRAGKGALSAEDAQRQRQLARPLGEKLRAASAELADRLRPALALLNTGAAAVLGGAATALHHYCAVREQLLLSLCANAGFVILLQNGGDDAQAHPVLSRLVSLTRRLDALQPLQAQAEKLIEVLLRSAAAAPARGASRGVAKRQRSESADEPRGVSVAAKKVAMHASKPSPAALRAAEAAEDALFESLPAAPKGSAAKLDADARAAVQASRLSKVDRARRGAGHADETGGDDEVGYTGAVPWKNRHDESDDDDDAAPRRARRADDDDDSDDDDEPPADGRAPPSNQERPESYACFDVVFQKLTLAEREATAPPTYKAVNYALALVRVAFMSVWLTAEMCVRVVALFPAADYARVECAHLLHARCYDLDRFYVILEMLETAERVELVHRLGWLNVANPVKPDVRGGYGLDLRYHDHRALVKVLVRLAAKEPGRNWQHVEFRYRDGQGSPGWTLPANWDLNDPGPRMNGFLLLTYSCEPKDGCAANFEVRNKLQQRFLCGRPLG